MRLIVFVVCAGMLHEAGAVTACAYRCDPSWAGLDTGVCADSGCPSPDSDYVMNNVCTGLPFQPSPGDILQHDEVPFDTEDACNSYLQSWESDVLQGLQGNVSGRLAVGDSDKTDFPTRGQIWSTAFGLMKNCVQVAECEHIVQGMNGKEVQDCINKCMFEYGEEKLEQWACDCASETYTGGLADWFCNNALGVIMEPINKFINSYIEQPVIDACESVEDAVASAGHRIASFFNFGWGDALVVV